MEDISSGAYQYKYIDKSITLPYLKRYYVGPLYRFVPLFLSANMITLLSSIAMWIALAIAYLYWGTTSPVILFTLVFLINFFLVGDILDGMRARATNSSSSLGEYLDHYLDIYNLSILLLLLAASLNITSVIAPIGVWVFHITFLAIVFEEKITGQLRFGKLGGVEIALSGLIFLASMVPSLGQAFWRGHYIQAIPNYYFPVGAFLFSGIMSAFDVCKRLYPFPKQFAFYLFCSGLLIFSMENLGAGIFLRFFALLFYSGNYLGAIIYSHLNRSKQLPWPNRIASIFIIVQAVLGIFYQAQIAWLALMPYFLVSYLGLLTGIDFFKTVKKLQRMV